jgi:hydrogenase maturation protease
MSGQPAPECLVIGVGNPWRGDDGAGPAVARALAGVPGLAVAECGGEPAELMERWAGFERVFLVDALVAGGRPGSIHRLTAEAPLPVVARHSSHGVGLAEAVELARALGELPPKLVIYGIEPGHLNEGAALSPAVVTAVASVAQAILDEWGGTD